MLHWDSSSNTLIFLSAINLSCISIYLIYRGGGERGGAVGWGTALQTGRLQDRFLMLSLIQSFQSPCGPRVDSASNRNEYQKYFLRGKGGRGGRLTTLPSPCAYFLEIWELQPPRNLMACSGLHRDFFTSIIYEMDNGTKAVTQKFVGFVSVETALKSQANNLGTFCSVIHY